MRAFIVVATILALLGLQYVEAGGLLRKEDIPKAIHNLRSGSPAERALAAEQLGHRGAVRMDDVKEAIALLQETVKHDKEANVRKAAAKALGDIAPDPETTVPVLIEALSDKAPAVQMAAVNALAQIGPDARPALPTLRKMAAEADKGPARTIKMAIGSISGKKKQ